MKYGHSSKVTEGSAYVEDAFVYETLSDLSSCLGAIYMKCCSKQTHAHTDRPAICQVLICSSLPLSHPSICDLYHNPIPFRILCLHDLTDCQRSSIRC